MPNGQSAALFELDICTCLDKLNLKAHQIFTKQLAHQEQLVCRKKKDILTNQKKISWFNCGGVSHQFSRTKINIHLSCHFSAIKKVIIIAMTKI
jgi:hypothetical protein